LGRVAVRERIEVREPVIVELELGEPVRLPGNEQGGAPEQQVRKLGETCAVDCLVVLGARREAAERFGRGFGHVRLRNYRIDGVSALRRSPVTHGPNPLQQQGLRISTCSDVVAHPTFASCVRSVSAAYWRAWLGVRHRNPTTLSSTNSSRRAVL